jgi:hypothetical protein
MYYNVKPTNRNNSYIAFKIIAQWQVVRVESNFSAKLPIALEGGVCLCWLIASSYVQHVIVDSNKATEEERILSLCKL